MTTCPRSENLYLYLEGELGPYEARKIEEHLERCEACREAMAERRLLHEAFTTLPPFEVPKGFAQSVMDSLPEPEAAKAGWLGPLVVGTTSLTVGLLGFYLLTGQNLSDVLVAFNRFFGSVVGRFLPLTVKLLKAGSLLLKVAGDFVSTIFEALAAFSRSLGPQGIVLILGLGVLISLLAFLGARRFLSVGEKT